MSIQYKVYLNGEFLGVTEDTNIDLPLLSYSTIYTWRVDVYDTDSDWTTTGTTWIFTTQIGSFYSPPSGRPRPEDYDPDLWWDETLGEWVPAAAGGGKYKQQLIVIGEDGEIYFGDV